MPVLFWRNLLTWWFTELATLFPCRIRSLRRGTFAVAYFNGHSLRIISERDDDVELFLPFSATLNPYGISQTSDRLINNIRDHKLTLILRLSPNLGLVIIDQLPSAAYRDLRSIISNRLDHLTPWTANAVMFETRRVHIPVDGVLQAEIVVVPRQIIARANVLLAHIGLVADIVDLASGDELAAPTYDLGRADRLPRLPRFVVAGAFAALTVALIFGASLSFDLRENYAIIERKRADMEVLESRLVDPKILNAHVNAIDEEKNLLRDLRLEHPSSLVVIESLSRVLPDDSWLETLRLTDQSLAVWGYAKDATPLLALIEAVPIFEAARFTSPSERTVLAGESQEPIETERFSLQMTVRAANKIEPEIWPRGTVP